MLYHIYFREYFFAYIDKYIMFLQLQINVTGDVMYRCSETGLWGQTGTSDTSYPC